MKLLSNRSVVFSALSYLYVHGLQLSVDCHKAQNKHELWSNQHLLMLFFGNVFGVMLCYTPLPCVCHFISSMQCMCGCVVSSSGSGSGQTMWLPTSCLQLLHRICAARPNHVIIAADFDELPDVTVPGQGSPLVASTVCLQHLLTSC